MKITFFKMSNDFIQNQLLHNFTASEFLNLFSGSLPPSHKTTGYNEINKNMSTEKFTTEKLRKGKAPPVNRSSVGTTLGRHRPFSQRQVGDGTLRAARLLLLKGP